MQIKICDLKNSLKKYINCYKGGDRNCSSKVMWKPTIKNVLKSLRDELISKPLNKFSYCPNMPGFWRLIR